MIVKRLDSIQNFGAMDVLCTDKTGTLTQDKIFLERHTDVFGQESDTVLNDAYLNSYYQTGLKNLRDVAVSEHADVHQELTINTAYCKVDEIPFYLVRRRMSVVVAKQTPERSPASILIGSPPRQVIVTGASHARTWLRREYKSHFCNKMNA
jgi:Mg2+-importing ATPase